MSSIKQSNEVIFAKEFEDMMKSLKGLYPEQSLYDVPIPNGLNLIGREKFEYVYIMDIEDEIYKQLNNTEAQLLKGVNLSRRKYDYKGEFMKDKNGDFIYEDISCPQECYAIATPIILGLRSDYKPEGRFEYVDYVDNEDSNRRKYVYIVPKKYLYKINLTALTLSWQKMPRYYTSVRVAVKTGRYLYVSVIPYKVNENDGKYRILHCKTNNDFTKEITALRDHWLATAYMFNPQLLELEEAYKGQSNLAIQSLDTSLDMYIRYDVNKSLANEAYMNMFMEQTDAEPTQ